jgi:hypothetical protein
VHCILINLLVHSCILINFALNTYHSLTDAESSKIIGSMSGGKGRDGGGAKEKEGEQEAFEEEEEQEEEEQEESSINTDKNATGRIEVPLPSKRKRLVDDDESESNSQKDTFAGRQTNAESPAESLVKEMDSLEDPFVMAKRYVARDLEGDISALKNYDHPNCLVMIRMLDFWMSHRSSTLNDARAFLNQDLFAVALSMMISLNGNPCLSQLIAHYPWLFFVPLLILGFCSQLVTWT